MGEKTEEARRGWLQVDQPVLLDALRELARFPLPNKKRKSRSKRFLQPVPTDKFILIREGRKLALSNGNTAVHVPVKGRWRTDAVLPYTMLKIIITLVAGLPETEPVLLEAFDNHLRIGGATFSCSFQDSRINVRAATNAEQEVQRVKTAPPREASFGYASWREPDAVAIKIRMIQPSCTFLLSARHHLLAFPDLPGLLVQISNFYIDFRIRSDTGPASEASLEKSTLWKRVGHEAIEAYGLDKLLNHAAHVAAGARDGATGGLRE